MISRFTYFIYKNFFEKGGDEVYYQPEINFSADEVLLYLRKSRSDDPDLSVEEVLLKHEQILDEWSDKHLVSRIPDENRFREVVSGETIDDRPEIQKMLKLIESPKYKAILIVEVQRLSRGDLEDAGRLIKLLRYTNTIVITPQKTFDLSNEYDRDFFERELKRGNEFLEYQKKIMNRGRLLSVSQGNFLGQFPPYGYEKTWIMDGKRKCPTLKENKEQADVIRMIFDMYVNQDMGRVNICHRLDSLGIKAPRGERWSPAALKDMLENVHYIGKVRWNWRKTVTVIENGEVVKTHPKNKIGDYLMYDGKHEGIVSEKIFWQAQEKSGRNHRAKAKTKVRNPLASLLYCQCGRAMSLRTYMKNGVERAPARLLCDDQVHCKTGSCLYDDIIKRVSAILKRAIYDFEVQLKNNNADSTNLHKQIINNLEKKLKDLEAKELSQWEAQSNPDPSLRMPTEIFAKLNKKLLAEKETIKQTLMREKQKSYEVSDYEEKIKRFTSALDALENPEITAQEKNRLLKACIQRIEYNRETPERLKRLPGEKKGERFKSSGGYWSEPPIELDVKLKLT